MSYGGQFARYHAWDIANCTAPVKFISGYFERPISLAFIGAFLNVTKQGIVWDIYLPYGAGGYRSNKIKYNKNSNEFYLLARDQFICIFPVYMKNSCL